MRENNRKLRNREERHGGAKPNLWRSFCLAMSTFTVIPFPQYAFHPVDLSWSLVFFPLAGLVGAAFAGASLFLLRLLGVGVFFRAVVALALLILSSGAIHLDGFADTCDALFSRRDRRVQLEIMRDPHIGVYAVIGTVLLLLTALAAWTEILATGRELLIVASLVYGVFGRSLSGLYSASLPSARGEGMQHAMHERVPKIAKGTLIVFLVCSALSVIAMAHWSGMIAVGLSLIVFVLFSRFSIKAFGGATGDLAGFLLSITEVAGWAVFALTQRLPAWY
ncbi:MAG TPA: adenosylcobinamide-GDP ribazoletransferase [Clostridiaceae bacterium]|jgi:adenosylcobinamide-GDP ribazoletransferase|nr:adenosylcobinamide-GDP ribazoletransferase [Clostridiaceae bacterium]